MDRAGRAFDLYSDDVDDSVFRAPSTGMLARAIFLFTNIWVYVFYCRVVWLHVRTTRSLPNPACPRRLNDKMLWRKIFDRNPDFVTASDKLKSQGLARRLCAEIKLPATLWTGRRSADIPTDLLAGDVMVKGTHGSGYVYPVFAGQFDADELHERTQSWLRQTYGRRHWEWAYFGLEPKLYVEQMLRGKRTGYQTTEIKLYVYCGRIGMIIVIYDRLTDSAAEVLNADWSRSRLGNSLGARPTQRPLPRNRRQIEDTAIRLCSGFDHMRCDLYLVDDDIYFGEYTVYDQGGYIILGDDEVLETAQAEAWDLRQSWFLETPQPGWKGIYANALRAQLASADRARGCN